MFISILVESLEHAVVISVFVLVMMLFVDYINVITKGRMSAIIKGGRMRQYFTASFLGSVPGCLGSFMNVSFYARGLISFGAIVGGMIATCGDEAFVMLAVFPKQALLLFAILFVVGVVSAILIDKLMPKLKIRLCEECKLSDIHDTDECRCLNIREIPEHFKKLSFSRFLLLSILLFSLFGMLFGGFGHGEWGWESITMCSLLLLALFIIITVPEHYLEEHIWQHIAKKHLWRVFLWSFGALTAVNILSSVWDFEAFV
ncbi:MAG: putative manganese transporter, partial [Candidatus Omnitrophota bacterium]